MTNFTNGDGSDADALRALYEQVDEILTDTSHPLDVKQSWKVSLALMQQMINFQLGIKRGLADLVVKLDTERIQQDNEIKAVRAEVQAVKGDVAEIKRTMSEYPSLTWLLRYKTTPTMRWIVAFLFVLYVVIRNYPAMATWLGLPPLP